MDPLGDMRQRIIETASTHLESEGEASIRLRHIAEVIGISEPSLYHYFTNREALITAAQAERYRRTISVVSPFVVEVGTSTNRAEFVAAVQRTYESAFLPERRRVRAIRAELLGSSMHRPELYEQISAMTRHALNEGVTALRTAQENRWLRADIDPDAFCLWIMAHMSNIVYAEMQNDERLLLAFKKIGLEALTALLGD